MCRWQIYLRSISEEMLHCAPIQMVTCTSTQISQVIRFFIRAMTNQKMIICGGCYLFWSVTSFSGHCEWICRQRIANRDSWDAVMCVWFFVRLCVFDDLWAFIIIAMQCWLHSFGIKWSIVQNFNKLWNKNTNDSIKLCGWFSFFLSFSLSCVHYLCASYLYWPEMNIEWVCFSYASINSFNVFVCQYVGVTLEYFSI